MSSIVRRWARAALSVVVLAVLALGAPAALVGLTRARFGGAAPWTGVDPPWMWQSGIIGDVVGGRVADSTIADALVRGSIVIVWVLVGLIVVTVLVELAHQLRHDGIPMPAMRGLGWSQVIARFVAAGLLVMTSHVGMARASSIPLTMPLGTAPVTAGLVVAERAVAAETAVAAADAALLVSSPHVATSSSRLTLPTTYVVRHGDSVMSIADRLAPSDPVAASRIADSIVELNLGATMADGGRFTNAAFLEAGWVLQMPPHPVATSDTVVGSDLVVATSASPVVHEVSEGDTLWGIAAAHLDDPLRWPEVWDRNSGAEMPDGRTFDDPDLIVPGWELEIPPNGSEPTPVLSIDGADDPDGADDDPADEPTDEPGDDVSRGGRVVEWDAGDPPVLGAPVRDHDAVGAINPDVAEVADETDVVDVSEAADETEGDDVPEVADEAAAVVPVVEHDPEPIARWDGQDLTVSRSSPLGPAHAAMLASGVLTLVAVRRRQRMRSATAIARAPEPKPVPAAFERVLSAVDAGKRLLRLDLAVRCAAATTADRDIAVVAALVDPSGGVELVLSESTDLPEPWSGEGRSWTMPPSVDIDELARLGRSVGLPSIALVQLGCCPEGREVYVDLETLGVLSVDAPATDADAIVRALTVTLASSVFAEVAQLIGVGIDADLTLGHRSATVRERLDDALAEAELAAAAVSATNRSTTALRARANGGETWEPVVVLAASSAASSANVGGVPPSRGRAVVLAGPCDAPGAVLAPSDGSWSLAGPALGDLRLELVPLGLDDDDTSALLELVEDTDRPLEVADARDTSDGVVHEPPLVVGLLGPVRVVTGEGEPVGFERSKSLELVAWLATHRERSTRTAARTALWELDVRDATFANVVSEARRTLARAVKPPVGEEWVGRTMTEQLPLHASVRSDADLVRRALSRAADRAAGDAIAELEPAVALIRGAPFEGTTYLWPDAEGLTSNLVLLATSAAVELARLHLAAGDVEGVFRATAAGLAVLPGHEELIALRMRAHARVGDHAGVRQEWESYERVVNSDPWSDGEPAPKLVELRRELLGPAPSSSERHATPAR